MPKISLILFFLLTLFFLSHAQKRNYSNLRCPPKCMCYGKSVRCMKLELQMVPQIATQAALYDLRFNKINNVEPGSFNGYRHLKSLLLNNNWLVHLKNGTFKGLVQLRHLYLDKNKINYIDSGVFQDLLKLEHLYLHSNYLKTLEDGTFSNLPHLNRLFLHNNQLQSISSGVFKNLPRLKRLRLDQNSLICDCKLAWLTEMLSKKYIQVAASCKYPTEMYGKSLKGMTVEDLHCSIPTIVEQPQDIETTPGETALFKCKVIGGPELNIIWVRNNKELNKIDNDKYLLMEDGSLMIKNVSTNDEGRYECMFKNHDIEVKSRAARMILVDEKHKNDGNPIIIEKPESVSTSVGEPYVQFTCRAIGNPEPVITWSFNGVKLLPTFRHNIQPNGNLVIQHIEAGDHGTYTCEALNALGRQRAEVNLLINSAPVFSVNPDNVDANIGGSIKLECVAEGLPPPTITWLKDDIEIKNSKRLTISNDGTSLKIKDSKESDSGLYICEARNSLGTREVSAKVKVSKSNIRPPHFVFKPFNIETYVGSTIEMPCVAEGDPKPGINWQKDGARMQVTGRTKISLSGSLYIYNVGIEDQGRYECIAINEHGRNSTYGYLTVKSTFDPDVVLSPGSIGDKFIKTAFLDATDEVDRAINNTIKSLFKNKGPHSSAELFRLFRFPDAPTRELAKAAEVYERTLVNIRKHVNSGMTTNLTKNFNYREILSKEHLDLIASLSGCNPHRRYQNCSDMCFHLKYRTLDGTCNNLQHPTWGSSLTPFRRILNPIYEDGFGKPVGWDKSKTYFGYHKPLARKISTSLLATTKITEDNQITHMTMQWGQFLDHDLDHALPSVSSQSWDGIDCKKSCNYSAPCFPMDIPKDDPRVTNRRCIDFIRTSAVCGSGMTSVFFDDIQPREQINQLTSYIDASQVYGFSEEMSRGLRDLNSDGGRLREGLQFTGKKPLLPYASNEGIDCRRNLSESDIGCFAAGDIRVNEQVALIAMHTLWMREHNRLARSLKELNPQWDGDTIFHEARKIVGAAMQHITYKHWLPYIIGNSGMEKLGKYKGYNPKLSAEISNEFATAALRFGHTLINPILYRFNENFEPIREGNLQLRDAFFSPWRVVEEGGVDPLLRGMFSVPAKVKKPSENLNTELTEQLFRTAHAVALDLAAMNIQRGRDHAIPGYVEYRKFCNMTNINDFEDLRFEIKDPKIRYKLKELYGHPGNIDIFVGGILEDPVDNARVGPLFQCLLIEQFRRLRDGDRFYYENPSVFKPEQLIQIKQYSLSRVLCDNSDNITQVPEDAFLLSHLQGGYRECSTISKVDIKFWAHCCNECSFSGQFNSFNNINFRSKRSLSNNNTISFLNEKFTENDVGNDFLYEKVRNLEKQVTDLQSTVKKLLKNKN